jgi:hypothetical protein
MSRAGASNQRNRRTRRAASREARHGRPGDRSGSHVFPTQRPGVGRRRIAPRACAGHRLQPVQRRCSENRRLSRSGSLGPSHREGRRRRAAAVGPRPLRLRVRGGLHVDAEEPRPDLVDDIGSVPPGRRHGLLCGPAETSARPSVRGVPPLPEGALRSRTIGLASRGHGRENGPT